MSQTLDRVSEPLQRAGAALGRLSKCLGEFIQAMAEFAAAALPVLTEAAQVQAALNEAPPRVRHLAQHSKKNRTRKKNINRALREYQRRSHKSDRP